MTPDTPLNVALATMLQKRIHRLPVVEESAPGKLVGIISERNLRLAADSPFLEESAQEVLEHLAKHKVKEIMKHAVVTVNEESPILEAAKLMRVSSIGGLPVLDSAGLLSGMVTRTDLLDHLIRLMEPLEPSTGGQQE